MQPTAVLKNDPKLIRSWAMFDWANSSYSLVISSAVFPAYFAAVTDKTIQVGNSFMPNSAYFTFTITIAYIFVALGLPILSGIADYSLSLIHISNLSIDKINEFLNKHVPDKRVGDKSEEE